MHQAVNEFFPDIIDVEFTAQMEKELDDVEEGNKKWVKVIDNFYKDFEKHVEFADAEMEKIEIKDEPAGEDCEKCGSQWFTNLVDTENLWHVRVSRIVVIRKQL